MKQITKLISAMMMAVLFVTMIQTTPVFASETEEEDTYFSVEAIEAYCYVNYGEKKELKCKVEIAEDEEESDLSGYKIVWSHEGKIIPNANSISYIVDTTQTEAEGTYEVTVTKGNYSNVCWFHVTVDSQLSYDGEEFEEYAKAPGESVKFEVKASSLCKNLTYQWKKRALDNIDEDLSYDWEEKPLDNTTSTLEIEKIAKEDYGNYCCIISDGISTIEKNFTLKSDSTLTTSIDGDEVKLVGLGQSVSMQITASSNYKIKYQWYREGKIIEGATSNRLSISHLEKEDYAKYECRVSDEYSATLECVSVKAFELPDEFQHYIFDVRSKSAFSFVDESLTLNVGEINKAPGVNLTYTWSKDLDNDDEHPASEIIEGATADSYTIPSVEEESEQNTNRYKVTISDGINEEYGYIVVKTDDYIHFINEGNQFNWYRSRNVETVKGERVSFPLTTKVKKGYKATYQWFMLGDYDYYTEWSEDAVKMPGQTSATLDLSSVTEEDLYKYYYCVAYIDTGDEVVTERSGVIYLTEE